MEPDRYTRLKERVVGTISGFSAIFKTFDAKPSVPRAYIICVIQGYYREHKEPVPSREEVNGILEELVEEKRLGFIQSETKARETPAGVETPIPYIH